jgi:hypothetical protein
MAVPFGNVQVYWLETELENGTSALGAILAASKFAGIRAWRI